MTQPAPLPTSALWAVWVWNGGCWQLNNVLQQRASVDTILQLLWTRFEFVEVQQLIPKEP